MLTTNEIITIISIIISFIFSLYGVYKYVNTKHLKAKQEANKQFHKLQDEVLVLKTQFHNQEKNNDRIFQKLNQIDKDIKILINKNSI